MKATHLALSDTGEAPATKDEACPSVSVGPGAFFRREGERERSLAGRKLGGMWIVEDVEPADNCREEAWPGTNETFQREHNWNVESSTKRNLLVPRNTRRYCQSLECPVT